MKDLRQHGIAVMTLSDLVDDFCLAQGNMRESMYLQQLRGARWSWKELFRTTLWNIKKAVLCVDCKTHTIKLPDDCERVYNISVVDFRGKIHPLGFNSDWNTAKITCIKSKCSCNVCNGEDSLCAVIDSISAVTETVVINGQNYTQTTLTRYDGSGAVQTQVTVPVWDVATSAVIYQTNITTSCNVETTTKGCIKATPANMALLQENFGAGLFLGQWGNLGQTWGNYNAYRELIPSPYNYFGEWNFNAADGQIVHIFSGCNLHYGHTEEQEAEWRGNVRQVIVEYLTNGETPDTEILVPEYAVECVQIGMVYRQKYLNPRVGEGDKMAAKQAWMAAKVQVAKYLNPMNMEVIAKLQTNARLW